AKARELLPDLILCDVKMNNQADAGYTTLARLREDAVTAAIPFILMTGFADSAGMRHGMELGADDYLPKPFKVDELYATVNTRLRKVKTVREDAERKLTTLRTQISLMMPHELRTPLNGIIANAELLASDAATLGTEAITEMGQEICKSGQRLERLIENFLFYARLEIVATDADSVIALRAAKILQPAALVRATAVRQAEVAERLTDLALDLADGPLPMAEEYFKKIVTELVQNAFKFSEAGTPVRVGLRANNEEIEFSVHDHGRGLSTEHIRRIDAYVQFERKMQDEQGLGLGLAIAKKLAELHGGRLTITSDQGTGTTVVVKLPKVRKA
ncbi:MAG TPA: hybrid sensor histidine kinase/response regulator, partial [Candidatus Binatia bacterium]|nr:hybrid sensor histidine kinase/response regulator [Candidatus Binatia bacterium]